MVARSRAWVVPALALAGAFPVLAGVASAKPLPVVAVDGSGAVTGRLLDDSREGVADARVVLKDRLRGTTVAATTDAEGRFRADGLAPGIWRVEIEPREHRPILRDAILVGPSEAIDLGSVAARPGSFVAGRVVGSDREPVAGAEVRAQDPTGGRHLRRTATTDEGGRFRIGGLPAGEVDVVVRPKSGFSPGSLRRVVPPLADATVEIAPSARLRGVVSAADGTVPTGLRVSAVALPSHSSWDPSGVTASTGEVDPKTGAFEVDAPAGGDVQVSVYAHGFKDVSTVVRIDPGREAEAVRLELERSPRSLRGVVTDREGRPVAGARIGIATTDAEGRFAIEGANPAQTQWVVTHPSFAPLSREIDPASESSVSLALDEGGAVEGTVTDWAGRPLAGVRIASDALGSSTVTRADGTYRLEHLPAGPIGIERRAPGPAGDIDRKNVEIRVGGTHRVDFVVGGAIVEGRVTRGGTPVEGLAISVDQPLVHPKNRGGDGRYQTTGTDEEGRFRLVGLEPGRATILIHDGSRSVAKAIVLPPAGEAIDLDLPDRIVEGVLLDLVGRPLSGACVAVPLGADSDGNPPTIDAEATPGTGWSRATTDAFGRFRLAVEAPEPGSVTACTCETGCREIRLDSPPDSGPVLLRL